MLVWLRRNAEGEWISMGVGGGNNVIKPVSNKMEAEQGRG